MVLTSKAARGFLPTSEELTWTHTRFRLAIGLITNRRDWFDNRYSAKFMRHRISWKWGSERR
jgi:hypothetical protein